MTSAGDTALQQRLAALLGAAAQAPDSELAQHAVEGIVPSAVVSAATEEDVSRVLRFATEHGLAVIPWGGGTGLHLGGVPRRADIVLRLRGLAAVLDYAPQDLNITVQAGITLAELQATVAEQGQMLPLDAPQPEQATVGGILAIDASGPLRLQFGTPRDLVLGTRVVYSDGVIAKSGGRVVKNVAGYDMTKLHIGAIGTLGVIVEASFKVLPIPKVWRTVAGTFRTLDDAATAALALHGTRIVPWSLLMFPPSALPTAGLDGDYAVAVRLAGLEQAVSAQAQRALETITRCRSAWAGDLPEAEHTLWPPARDWAAVAPDSIIVRLGMLPSQTRDMVTALHKTAARHNLVASTIVFPGTALAYCRLPATPAAAPALRELQATVKAVDGSFIVEQCPPAMKEHIDIWGAPSSSFFLFERVKATFDPHRTLNPGRFVGGL